MLTRVPDGTLLYELATTGGPGHIGLAPIALAFSPDGKTLATATHDGKVRLWDPARARRAALPGSQRPER